MKLNNKYWPATITVIVAAVLLIKYQTCFDGSVDVRALERKINSLKDIVDSLQDEVDPKEFQILKASKHKPMGFLKAAIKCSRLA